MVMGCCWCMSALAGEIRITPDSSLADAIRQAREMKRTGKALTMTIHLAPGIYQLYEPIRLRPEDSGLTIIGHDAIISGGQEINIWKEQDQSLYVADIPDFNGRPVDFRQLWRNREKALRARDVVDFEQMHRILTYDKRNQALWIPKAAVASLLHEDKVKEGCEYIEMVLHEMWCTSNLRIKSLTPQGDSVAMRFHDPDCRHVNSINPDNRRDFYGTRDEAIALGYVPCGSCKP